MGAFRGASFSKRAYFAPYKGPPNHLPTTYLPAAALPPLPPSETDQYTYLCLTWCEQVIDMSAGIESLSKYRTCKCRRDGSFSVSTD